VKIVLIFVRAVKQTDAELPRGKSPANHALKCSLTKTEQRSFAFAPYFKPDGFGSPDSVDDGGQQTGIAGEWGQFLAIWLGLPFSHDPWY
jgi:hypothetical protein